jgi:hypothetical protein
MLTAVEAELRQARAAQATELAAAATAPAHRAAQLHRLRAIGPGTAALLAKELFSRELRNRREVGALTGLVGVPYASGATAQEQGISRAGLSRVRGVAVELAWLWRRYQPDSELTQWFDRRWGADGKRARKIGIVALARRLMVALWRYVETGVVPAGATVRGRVPRVRRWADRELVIGARESGGVPVVPVLQKEPDPPGVVLAPRAHTGCGARPVAVVTDGSSCEARQAPHRERRASSSRDGRNVGTLVSWSGHTSASAARPAA